MVRFTIEREENNMNCFICENIKCLRKKAEMTQEEMALELGVSRQSLAKWENGESLPDIANCLRISELFDISLDMLVRFSIEKNEESDGNTSGKYIFGMTSVDANGVVTLPENARQVFEISEGDTLVVMGDTDKGGIALAKIMGKGILGGMR